MDLNRMPPDQRLGELWATHGSAGWPDSVPSCGDEQWDAVAVEPVVLDADISGVIAKVVGSRRPPDVAQQATLAGGIEELDRAWAAVPMEAQPYF